MTAGMLGQEMKARYSVAVWSGEPGGEAGGETKMRC